MRSFALVAALAASLSLTACGEDKEINTSASSSDGDQEQTSSASKSPARASGSNGHPGQMSRDEAYEHYGIEQDPRSLSRQTHAAITANMTDEELRAYMRANGG